MELKKITMAFDTSGFMATIRTAVYDGLDADKPSLRDIESYTGVSASTLSRIDNGHVPDMNTFMLLCEVCDLTPGMYFKLIKWTGEVIS